MKTILPFLFVITFLSACDKQGLILKGEPGGDIAYKDLTKLSLSNFNDSTSTIQIELNNYPLSDDFGICELYLSLNDLSGQVENGILPETYATDDTLFKIGTYSNTITENLSTTLETDSNNFNFNFCYLLIKYNNRNLIISDTLAWQHAIIVNPF